MYSIKVELSTTCILWNSTGRACYLYSVADYYNIAKFTYEQYATVNQQLQDVLTRGSLSTAFKK